MRNGHGNDLGYTADGKTVTKAFFVSRLANYVLADTLERVGWGIGMGE